MYPFTASKNTHFASQQSCQKYQKCYEWFARIWKCIQFCVCLRWDFQRSSSPEPLEPLNMLNESTAGVSDGTLHVQGMKDLMLKSLRPWKRQCQTPFQKNIRNWCLFSMGGLEKWKHWWLLMENPLNWLSTPPSISGCEFPTQTSGWTPTQPECIRVLCANHHCNWWDHSTVGYSGSWSRTISGGTLPSSAVPRFGWIDLVMSVDCWWWLNYIPMTDPWCWYIC